jgi:hypothetical protein
MPPVLSYCAPMERERVYTRDEHREDPAVPCIPKRLRDQKNKL